MSTVRNYEAITPQVVDTQPLPEPQPGSQPGSQPAAQPEAQSAPQSGPRRTYFPMPEHLIAPEPKPSLCCRICLPCCVCLQMFAGVAELCCLVCNCRKN